jgi:RNA polymerase sigma-70 factor, ECF subfamily
VPAPLSPPDDEELVSSARSGDREAFGRLVHRHHGVVFRYLLARVRDEDRAADLTQETFLKALRSIDSFRGEASFRTWLLSIARNEARGSFRKEGLRGERALEEAAHVPDRKPGPDQEAANELELGRVRELMLRLPEKQRLSVWLRVFDGLSFREVAEATGSTEGGARVNYFHGIRRLREWLDDE